MSEFADLVRRALRDKGYSMKAAARAMNYDVLYLSRVLNGKQKPSPGVGDAQSRIAVYVTSWITPPGPAKLRS